MATDGPDPPSCDPDVYANGTVVAYAQTRGACAFEEYIQFCRRDVKGCKIDWHYVGGRAVVKVLGDVAVGVEALKEFAFIHPGKIQFVR